MTVDLVRPDAEPARPPVPGPRQLSATVSLIQQTALDLQAAHQIAVAICQTALAPKDFRGKPDDGAAAIMLGATLGLDPMISLQNIFIVHGAPSMYARTMAAVVEAQGHKLWTEHEAEGTVTVCGQRKDDPNIERVTFTIRDAERAGYTKQNAKYLSDPKSMLYARALSICARRTAPDALLGVPYSVEERWDMEDDAPVVAERSSVSRLRSAVPEAQPAIEATPPADEPAEPVGDATGPTKITAAQRKALGTLFTKHGMGRGDAVAYTASAIGRDIDSSDELTRDEATTVVRLLEAIDGPVDAEVVEPTAEDIAALNAEANADAAESDTAATGLFGES